MRREQFDQGAPIRQAVQRGDIVEVGGGDRQAVRLAVVDHLQAMLDGPMDTVGGGKSAGIVHRYPSRLRQRANRLERRRHAQRGLAAAVDQLMDLREELDLADAAAAALEVVAGAEQLALNMMVANPVRDRTDLADRTVIERAAPHERADLGEEAAAEPDIAGCGARADESGAFPRQRTRFVIG